MGAGPVSEDFLARLRRRVWPGSNPLRRRTDLFEPVALLIASLLGIAALVVGFAVAQTVLQDRVAEVRTEQASRHQEQVRVLADLKGDDPISRTVAVGWEPQPGDRRFAVIEVPLDGPLPETMSIWVDREQHPMPPPRTPSEATQAAGTVGAGVILCSAFGIAVLYGGASWCVHHRRLAAWEAEWAQVGPKWRHYLP